MRGDKGNLTRRQEMLITALLQSGVVARAAQSVRVSEATAWRWLQNEQFLSAYRAARRMLTEQSTAVLQHASNIAAARLIDLMRGDDVPPSVQLGAARSILEFAREGQELEDVQERIAAIEQMLVRVNDKEGRRRK